MSKTESRLLKRLYRWLYGWLCERLYHELAGAYDAISWLVSVGHWDEWRSLALLQLDEDRVAHMPRSKNRRVSDAGSLMYARDDALRRADVAVLELGCGTGALLQCLAKRWNGQSGVVVGLDRSPAMIAVAARRLATQSLPWHVGHSTTASPLDLNGGVRLIRGAAETLPLGDHAVGAVVSTFPAPYILDYETLQECWRVLHKPNASHHAPTDERTTGRLVIVGLWVRPAGNSLSAQLMRLLPVFYGAPSEAVQQEMTLRIEAAGFRVTLVEVSARNAWVGTAVAYPIASVADNAP